MNRVFGKLGKKNTLTLSDDGLEKALEKAIKESPEKASRSVMECLLDLAGQSARRAPIESGDLRSNCHATFGGATIYQNQQAQPSMPSETPTPWGAVGYSLPYALRQHEDMKYRHDRTDGYRRPDGTTVNMIAGGEAKYLEQPFDDSKDRYIKHIQDSVVKTLE